jgi:hypothetical protein
VELVSRGDPEDFWGGGFKSAKVLLLTGSPWRLWDLIGIAQRTHQFRNNVSECFTNPFQRGLAALILNCVVEEPSDGFILGSTVLQDKAGDCHQM